jgi:uncharacterized membrane protein
MNATGERLVDDYLDRLDDALADLPGAERREIVEEITEHIAVARAELGPDDEAGLRTLLDRLGDPDQIAADAHGRSAPAQTRAAAGRRRSRSSCCSAAASSPASAGSPASSCSGSRLSGRSATS